MTSLKAFLKKKFEGVPGVNEILQEFADDYINGLIQHMKDVKMAYNDTFDEVVKYMKDSG